MEQTQEDQLKKLAKELVTPWRFGHLAVDRMPESELDADRMLALADEALGDTIEFEPINVFYLRNLKSLPGNPWTNDAA